MRRALAILLLLLAGVPAKAQSTYPCPQISFGWATSFTGQAISSIAYDSFSQLLYVVFTPPHGVSAFANVPLNIFNTFSQAGNPGAFYTCCVQPNYHALLLNNANNCPLLFETGSYIFTD